MTAAWSEDRLDDEIRRFLDLRWHEVAGAATADRLSSRMGAGRAGRAGWRSRGLRVVPLIAAAVTLALVAASVSFVGRDREPVASAQPTSTAIASPTTSSPPSAAVAPRASVAPPTPIGRISVVRADGNWKDDIFETPRGFAAFTETQVSVSCSWPCPDPHPNDVQRTTYWESADGITWREAAPPVPGDGPFEHVAAGSEHWIWSQAERRAWRSPDYATWTEIDLGFLSFGSPQEVEFGLEPPITNGSTTLVPWSALGQADPGGLLLATEAGVESIAEPWNADDALETRTTLASIGGRFVALRPAGGARAPWGSPAQDAGLWESSDGRTWSYLGKPVGLPFGLEVKLVDGLASGASDPFVAILSGSLYSSADGLSWRFLSWAPAGVYEMAGAFVGIDGPDIFVSSNGEDWWTPAETQDALGSRVRSGYWSPYRTGPHWIAVPDDEDGPKTWLIGYGVGAEIDVPVEPTALP
jgi:hypothetical protein